MRLEGEEMNVVQNSGLGGQQSQKNTLLYLQAQYTNFKCLQALPSSSCIKRFSPPSDYTQEYTSEAVLEKFTLVTTLSLENGTGEPK